MAGKTPTPSLGRDDADFATFSFQYDNYMQLYDHGTIPGNAAVQRKEMDKREFALLTLLTKDNQRAQAFLVRHKRAEEAAGRNVSGAKAFKAMDEMFQPRVDQTKSRKIKELKKAMQNCWSGESESRNDAIVKVQMLMNDCVHLECAPDEKQMVIDFLGYMPEDGAWGVRKAMWIESEIESVADLLEKIRSADSTIGDNDKEEAVKAFVGKTQCKICKKFHGGECRYKNKHRSEHRRNFDDSQKRCFVCGKKGHLSFNCPKRKRSEDDNDGSGDSDMDYEAFKKAKRQMKKNRQEIQVPGF